MSKRKSLARLAVERSQCSQDVPEEPLHRSSSNVRPLSQMASVEVLYGGNDGDRQPAPYHAASNGAAPVPGPPQVSVTRRPAGRSSAERREPAVRPSSAAPARSNRHSYPAAAALSGQGRAGRPGWPSEGADQWADTGPQRPAGASQQRPAAAADSAPAVALSPPADCDGDAAPGAADGLPCASPSSSSGSSSGSSDQSGLLTVRSMHHAHSTNDLQQQRPADGGSAPAWSEPMSAGHRARWVLTVPRPRPPPVAGSLCLTGVGFW